MAQTAVHLVDHVLPPVPVRQWVLTLPFRLRYLVAFDAALHADVRRIFVRAVFRWLRALARRRRIADPQPAAVVFAQRAGSGLNLAPHFHAAIPDGVYDDAALFHRLPAPTDDDVANITWRIHTQVERLLARRGHRPADPDDGIPADLPLPFDSPTLATSYTASVQRRVGFGPPSGAQRLGRRPDAPFVAFSGRRCAALEGFTLHANTRVSGRDRPALERLLRYMARPAVATERLAVNDAGRVTYQLRKPWNDGTHTLEFDPLVFLDRLAALVPPPRANLVTYHGVLAPHAALREAVVRQAPLGSTASPAWRRPVSCDPPVLQGAGGTTATPVRRRRERYSWAALLMRVFALDILRCPCGARREIIAMITDPPVIRAILECLHLYPDEVVTDPAHGPP